MLTNHLIGFNYPIYRTYILNPTTARQGNDLRLCSAD